MANKERGRTVPDRLMPRPMLGTWRPAMLMPWVPMGMLIGMPCSPCDGRYRPDICDMLRCDWPSASERERTRLTGWPLLLACIE